MHASLLLAALCLSQIRPGSDPARASDPPVPRFDLQSSSKGELPVPPAGDQQTAAITFDCNGDGRCDIVIAERTKAPAVVGLCLTDDGWNTQVIDARKDRPEAGGVAFDVDSDGDLDLILGGDGGSDQLWWYENPGSRADPTAGWTRRVIKSGGGKAHHDQVVADLIGAGRPQLYFWNQGASALYMARFPAEPRSAGPWPLTKVLDTSEVPAAIKQEGMSVADIDGDGTLDLLAGLYWFRHRDGETLEAIQVTDHPGRIKAGRFQPGKVAQIIVAPGDGTGPLKMLTCAGADPADPASWVSHTLLDRDVIHGHTLELGDINSDGHLDIFCAEMARWGKGPEPDHPGATAWILYGRGDGTFQTTVLSRGMGFHEGRLADIDGDGRLDVVNKPYNWETPRLDIWFNRGVANEKTVRP